MEIKKEAEKRAKVLNAKKVEAFKRAEIIAESIRVITAIDYGLMQATPNELLDLDADMPSPDEEQKVPKTDKIQVNKGIGSNRSNDFGPVIIKMRKAEDQKKEGDNEIVRPVSGNDGHCSRQDPNPFAPPENE